MTAFSKFTLVTCIPWSLFINHAKIKQWKCDYFEFCWCIMISAFCELVLGILGVAKGFQGLVLLCLLGFSITPSRLTRPLNMLKDMLSVWPSLHTQIVFCIFAYFALWAVKLSISHITMWFWIRLLSLQTLQSSALLWYTFLFKMDYYK